MKKEVIEIQNLKCEGCMNTVAQTLGKFPEVTHVDIDLENSIVNIVTQAEDNRLAYEEALTNAGYPPVGAANPFYRKAKSYVSCAIGRASK